MLSPAVNKAAFLKVEIEMSDSNEKYVIVRSRDAGVHAGWLVERTGTEVRLREARRLWYWVCAQGDFLSGVAKYGLKPESKVGGEIDITVLGVCEVIDCTETARESIQATREHGRS